MSFPRKRESIIIKPLGPRFRGDDDVCFCHFDNAPQQHRTIQEIYYGHPALRP
jgi:hypothetical protein